MVEFAAPTLILIVFTIASVSTNASSFHRSVGLSFIPTKHDNYKNDVSKLIRSHNRKTIVDRNVNDVWAVNCVPRGGSLTENNKSDGIIIDKLRNVVRSLLEIGDKKYPFLARNLRSVINTFELLSGINLLPIPIKKKGKKRSRKKNVDASKSVKKEGDKKKKEVRTKPPPRKAEPIKASLFAKSHLSKDLKATNPNYRIQRELKQFLSSPPPNLSVKVGKNIRVWIFTLTGAKNTIYEGDKYRLRVKFPVDYPTVPPSVFFLQPSPRHEHVYTNGDICLSLLGKDWRPTMTAQVRTIDYVFQNFSHCLFGISS